MKTYELKTIIKSYTFNKAAGECLLKLAQYVSIVLSIDKGIPNEIRKANDSKYLVITDNGEAIELKY